jgi:hypothetical protein
MELQWEVIQISKDLQTRTDRLKVIGGWLVKTLTVVNVLQNDVTRTDIKVTTNFIADLTHHWVCTPSTPDFAEVPVKDNKKVKPKRKAVKRKKRR